MIRRCRCPHCLDRGCEKCPPRWNGALALDAGIRSDQWVESEPRNWWPKIKKAKPKSPKEGFSRRSFFFFGAILAARPGIVVPEAPLTDLLAYWKPPPGPDVVVCDKQAYEALRSLYWHGLPPYVPMNWAEVPWERKDGPLITRLLVPNQTGNRHG